VSNTIADLERRLALSEDEIDLLEMRLARIEDAVIGGEEVPVELAMRLLSGDNPVRVWREHRGLSLRELGRRAGVSPQLLSEIETGKKEGSLRTLRAIARELGVELDELVPWPRE
jgi:DNA-binding XRE family transcriptional regulator